MNNDNRHGCNSNRGDCRYSHSINDIICIRLRFKLLHYWLGSLVTFTGDKKSDTYSLVSV